LSRLDSKERKLEETDLLLEFFLYFDLFYVYFGGSLFSSVLSSEEKSSLKEAGKGKR